MLDTTPLCVPCEFDTFVPMHFTHHQKFKMFHEIKMYVCVWLRHSCMPTIDAGATFAPPDRSTLHTREVDYIYFHLHLYLTNHRFGCARYVGAE